MPVIRCPKCPTQLKIPEGVSGNTRCPKCGNVFPVKQLPTAPATPAATTAPKPVPKPATKPAPLPPPPPPAAKPKAPEPAFEVVDTPKKKALSLDDDDEDEDEPPRKKKPSRDDDDDDDDDRPRSKKRSRDDDDDEDDRPRSKKKKKKRYSDDDEFDDWRPRGGAGSAEFAKGKTGALMLGISYWLNLAAYGMLTLYILIAWLGSLGASESSSSSSRGRSSSSGSGEGAVEILEMIVILPGLIGLGAWVLGIVGSSIAIAGPKKARGMAITTTVFAAVHLIFVAVTFSNLQADLGSFGRGLPVVSKLPWIAVASLLPVVDSFLPMLFYGSKLIGGEYVLALLAGVCEAGRLIFGLLLLKAMATAAKDFDASERSGYGVMIVSGVLGGVVVLVLLTVILVVEGRLQSMSLVFGVVFLCYLAYTLMMLSPAIAAFGTKDACARRT